MQTKEQRANIYHAPLTDGNKVCRKCAKTKPYVDFSPARRNEDGRDSFCRECRRTADRARYNANPRKFIDKTIQWNNNNPEKHKENKQKYAKSHREEEKERWKKWIKRNLERHRQTSSNYCKTHRSEYARKSRERYPVNREIRQRSNRKWMLANPLKGVEYNQRRRARHSGVVSSIDANQWKLVLDLCGHKCLRCGETKKIQRDHVIPLNPGTDTLDNIQPLCQSCNVSKFRTAVDYRPKWLRELVQVEMLTLGIF